MSSQVRRQCTACLRSSRTFHAQQYPYRKRSWARNILEELGQADRQAGRQTGMSTSSVLSSKTPSSPLSSLLSTLCVCVCEVWWVPLCTVHSLPSHPLPFYSSLRQS